MASVNASLWTRHLWLALAFYLGYFGHVCCYAPEIPVTCRGMIDLRTNQYDAGVIVSNLPERIPIYANEEEKCDIHVSVPMGYELMFYFDWLDFYSADMTKCDSTNIQLFDGSAGQYVKGLQKEICGQEEQMPADVYFIEKQFLILRVNALGVIHGSGFRIHFTVSRRAFPCSNEEFACQTFGARRCIKEHLVCDDWNDCGDWVDEEQDCNNVTAGGIAAIVIAAVALVALIVGLIIFCKIRRDRELRAFTEKDPAIMRDISGASVHSGGVHAPYSISSEQLEKERYVPKYANSRSSRRGKDTNFKSDYEEERPPPYSEKGPNDSRSEADFDEEPRRNRSRRGRDDEVFEEEERRSRRGRRSRTSSVERDVRPMNDDRDRDHPPPPRDEHYPARRGPDDSRDSDRDFPPPPPPPEDNSSRRPDRDSRRRDDRDRDRDYRRSRRDEPEDQSSSDSDMRRSKDALAPLRELTTKLQSDSEPESCDDRGGRPRTSRSRTPPPQDRDDDRRQPPRDRDRDDDRRQPPRDRDDDRRQPPRDSYRDDDRRQPPRDRDRDDDRRPPPPRDDDRRPPPPRDEDRRQPPRDRDDRGSSVRDRDDDRTPPPGRNDRPISRRDPREDREDTPPKSRPVRSGSPPPPAPYDDDEEDDDDDAPRKRRRRRSRSREDRQRSRYGDAAKNGGEPGRESVGGNFREQAV